MEKKRELLKQESLEILISKEQQFYKDVHFILQPAREEAYNSANGIMTYAYWNVGQRIVEQEQYGEMKAKYGSYLIKNLSKQLSDEFGTGFSVANLRNCRQFYLVFPEHSYGFSMAGKLESDLETCIINNLQKFLLEMGKGFSFVGRQMRICTETTDFYIDLVFYNYILKCFVIIDLKTKN